MARKLPWKDGEPGQISSTRTKSRLKSNEDSTPDETVQHRGRKDENRDGDGEPDHIDDSKYRITESEFSATAQLFLADLNRQAYERLLSQQRRQIMSSTALDDLLDQPLLQQAMPKLPPRTASSYVKVKVEEESAVAPKPRPLSFTPGDPDTAMGSSMPSNKPPEKSIKEEVPIMVNAISTARAANHIDNVKHDGPPKMSEAALARKRKREQAQKVQQQPDIKAIPLFYPP